MGREETTGVEKRTRDTPTQFVAARVDVQCQRTRLSPDLLCVTSSMALPREISRRLTRTIRNNSISPSFTRRDTTASPALSTLALSVSAPLLAAPVPKETATSDTPPKSAKTSEITSPAVQLSLSFPRRT